MKFKDLKKGRIYTDKDGVYAYKFIRMRNDCLATFLECEYDEQKCDFIPTKKEVYLTKFEVEELQ